MRRQKEARKQVRYFADALGDPEISVRVHEEVDLTTALVGLPNADKLQKVAEAQKKVVERYADLSFEIIVYYVEDLRRASVRDLIDRAAAV